MAEGRLESALARVNVDNYFLNGERTENILKRMERQGYIVKIRERDGGGEETVDYMVGPRGKAEIGERGVASMARRVYAKKDAERDELDRKLVRSLGDVVLDKKPGEGAEDAEAGDAQQETGQEQDERPEGRGRGKGGRRQSKRTSARRNQAAREAVDEEAQDDDEGEEDEDE